VKPFDAKSMLDRSDLTRHPDPVLNLAVSCKAAST
jgi:hypothetical protein